MRPLRLDDLPVIARWYEDVEDLALFHRRMPLPHGAEVLDAGWRSALLAPEPRESYWFAITNDEGEPAGLGGIEDISYVHGDAVTPLFLSPSVRGKGLGVRARALLLDLAFDQLRLVRVTSLHRADNVASRRINEACGLREEGRIRRGWFAGGVHIDLMIFGILAEEWRAHRDGLRERLSNRTVITLGRTSSGRWSWPGTEPREVGDGAGG